MAKSTSVAAPDIIAESLKYVRNATIEVIPSTKPISKKERVIKMNVVPKTIDLPVDYSEALLLSGPSKMIPFS